MIDSDRAQFISQPYRYEVVSDAAVKAAYPLSTPVEINTNLGLASATALANSILAWSKTLGQVYEVEIEDVLTPDDFAGGVPHYTLSAPLYSTDGRTFKLIGCEVDYERAITKLTVRG